MKLPQVNFARTKTIIHAFQGFVIFLGWALTIAVFTKDGPNDGRTSYYFALCWFTVPALVYLAAIPQWPRTRRFGNPYVFAVVDVVFTVLWLAAWIAVASYVGAGKSAGDDEDGSGCDAFAYGSPGKCKLSTGTVILGVIVCVLFAGTSYMSYTSLVEYRRTGMMPYDGSDPTFAAQSKAAFSSNVAHDFDEEEGDGDGRDFRSGRFKDHQPSHRDDDDYALLQQNELEDMGGRNGGGPTQPYDPTSSRPVPGPGQPPLPMPDVHPDSLMHDYDTSYGGPYGGRQSPPGYGGSNPYGR